MTYEQQPTKFCGTIEVLEVTEDTKEALRNLSEMAEAMGRVFEQVMKVVKKMVGTCPNRRVVYLATHGSPRVRKKNTKRIVRYYKKHLKEEAEK